MPDNNMNTARQWANELFKESSIPKTLPDSLQDVNTRARVVNAVNDSLAPFISKYLKPENRGQIEYFPSNGKREFLEHISNITRDPILDIYDDKMRVAIALFYGPDVSLLQRNYLHSLMTVRIPLKAGNMPLKR